MTGLCIIYFIYYYLYHIEIIHTTLIASKTDKITKKNILIKIKMLNIEVLKTVLYENTIF